MAARAVIQRHLAHRVTQKSERSRHGLRAGKKPRCHPVAVARQMSRRDDEAGANQCLDHGKTDHTQTGPAERAEKLRPYVIAYRKEEKQKKDGFEHIGDNDFHLSDDDTHNQSRGHRAERKRPEFDFTEPKTESNCQEQRYHRVIPHESYQPVH